MIKIKQLKIYIHVEVAYVWKFKEENVNKERRGHILLRHILSTETIKNQRVQRAKKK